MKFSNLRLPTFNQAKVNFTEVAVANLGSFQIVVPTSYRKVNQPFFSGHVSVTKRDYSREGWVIANNKIVCSLFELDLGEILMAEGNCKPIKRLAPAVPIAFETSSHHPLPLNILESASFSYQFEGEASSYASVFRKLRPRFVRIYPIQRFHKKQILDKVKLFLAEETQFVTENREQLKQNPFYCEKFHLF